MTRKDERCAIDGDWRQRSMLTDQQTSSDVVKLPLTNAVLMMYIMVGLCVV